MLEKALHKGPVHHVVSHRFLERILIVNAEKGPVAEAWKEHTNPVQCPRKVAHDKGRCSADRGVPHATRQASPDSSSQAGLLSDPSPAEIGRAACRERVCQYV